MRRAAPALVVLALVAGARLPATADGIMLVPAGPFWMGRDHGAPEEAPLHRVYLPAVWIERHKVTNAELAAFLEAVGPRGARGERRYATGAAGARVHLAGGAWRADAGFEQHPAAGVSWYGARDFCAWRGRRLPTEAEWEKAARGDDQRPYPWGTTPPRPDLAVFGRPAGATERGDARPAGASAAGVEDLLGNLREWTASALRAYPYRADADRAGWDGHDRVVVRGASHDDAAATLHAAARHGYDRRGAAAGHPDVGFRCATSEDLGEVAPGRR